MRKISHFEMKLIRGFSRAVFSAFLRSVMPGIAILCIAIMCIAILCIAILCMGILFCGCEREADEAVVCGKCGAVYEGGIPEELRSSFACTDCGAPYAIMTDGNAPSEFEILYPPSPYGETAVTSTPTLKLPPIIETDDTGLPLRFEYRSRSSDITYRWVVTRTHDGFILSIGGEKAEVFAIEADSDPLAELCEAALALRDNGGGVMLKIVYSDRSEYRRVTEIGKALRGIMNGLEDTVRRQ